jgi:hypothetical protein
MRNCFSSPIFKRGALKRGGFIFRFFFMDIHATAILLSNILLLDMNFLCREYVKYIYI